MNKLNEDQTMDRPAKPVQWTWIAQRSGTDGDAVSIWKFGFVAPDGGEVQVTFHQIGEPPRDQPDAEQQTPPEQEAPPQDQSPQSPGQQPSGLSPDEQKAFTQTQGQGGGINPGADSSSMGMGAGMSGGGYGMDPNMGAGMMPPTMPPQTFVPAGRPDSDKTEDATFYVTFFSNRHPERFMQWDASLSHEDSLTTWVTITHGIVDFVRKAHPQNVILDDLANGKLKMVLRSVAMDVASSNPEYEIEQTQKHHYSTYYQIKKKDAPSAFQSEIADKKIEGEKAVPQSVTKDTSDDNGIAQETPQSKAPDPDAQQPQFPTADQSVQIKKTPAPKQGFKIEIGRDYSVAVKDRSGNAVDRYRAKGPADILRWINRKGYAGNQMQIVPNELPSGKPMEEKAIPVSSFVIENKAIKVLLPLAPRQAALMNYMVNAEAVRAVSDAVNFEFSTDRDMQFKQILVELAYERTKGI